MIKSLSGGLPLTDKTAQRGANKFRSPLFYIFYFLKYMIKANPSPNGNGFAFNLFGDPNGILTYPTSGDPCQNLARHVCSSMTNERWVLTDIEVKNKRQAKTCLLFW